MLWALVFSGLIGQAEPFDWVRQEGYRYAELPIPNDRGPGFTKLPPETTGIDFTNRLADLVAATNQIRMNGSGVALGDVDGDGYCDIYVCGLESPNALYLNRGGWRFEKASAVEVECRDQFSTGCALADLDGNGTLDLLVNGIGRGTRLFLNHGHGIFHESHESGLTNRLTPMTLAVGDVDGDTDLDVYATHYRTTTIRSTGLRLIVRDGQRMLPPEDRDQFEITPDGMLREYGEIDLLYLNQGNGHFDPSPWINGRFQTSDGRTLPHPPREWGQCAAFRDLNGDLLPDLYVCNDFWNPDRLWINQGAGTFQEAPPPALRNIPTFSMAVDFADLNRDGKDDWIALDMLSRRHVQRMVQASGMESAAMGPEVNRPQVERNTLFLNRGDGTFAEIARLAGLEATGWSWSPVFLDVDLDGYEDLLITTGFLFDTQDIDGERRIRALGRRPPQQFHENLLHYPKLPLPNLAFQNRHDLTFMDSSRAWGFDFNGISQGMATADLDKDGDLDLVTNDMNSVLGIYRNNSGAPRLAVRLAGRDQNSAGIGSQIRVRGGPAPQQQEIIAGSRYLSSDQAIRTFAAGSARSLRLEVRWRSGRHSLITNAVPGRIYEIREPHTIPQAPPPTNRTATLFRDVTHLLPHRHTEAPFNDWDRSPLLPHGYSQLGPGIAWTDFNHNQNPDLLIGTGSGGDLAAFSNESGKVFRALDVPESWRHLTRDLAGIAAIPTGPTSHLFLLGLSNLESTPKTESALAILNQDFQEVRRLPIGPAAAGPISLADINGDGRPDVFVGGRMVPGKFPHPADSTIFLNLPEGFHPCPKNQNAMKRLGLVSGSVFSDLDLDGDPDLIVATEWGPLRVFTNRHGTLIEITQALGLDDYRGFWNGVTTGDFNNDGRPDILASNWGRNSPYQRHRHHPIRLYYADFDGNGRIDAIEAYHDPESNQFVPRLTWDALAKGIPYIKGRFFTYRDYGLADIATVVGKTWKTAECLSANWLESTLFLNHADHIEALPLPMEAQFSPAFAVIACDVNGDGNEDAFLSQNFFHVRPGDSRCDAGRGLWLLGDGTGNLSALPGVHSGIQCYGQQRGAAVADFNRDGRIDLALTQNQQETRLYQNITATPGLRIHLQGPPENPVAIGALLRLEFHDGSLGAAREIHAGSGYWSQNEPVPILGRAAEARFVRIRWPDGHSTRTPVPPKSLDLVITPNP